MMTNRFRRPDTRVKRAWARLLRVTFLCALLGPLAPPALAQESEAPEQVNAQEPVEALVDPTSARGRLNAIRTDLVQLRFEIALASIDGLLSEGGLTADERTDAIILRAQTHVATGDLDGAANDYGEILRRRPTYVPDPNLTPKKAMQRFNAVRKEIIGSLRLMLKPQDAVLTVDGNPVALDDEGVLLLPEGEYTLRGDRQGYDPFDVTVQVVPDAEQPVVLELTPNARSVVLRTEPEGVEVYLDGNFMGTTMRPPMLPGASRQPAELLLPNLSLGEHEYDLRLPCHRDERRRDILTVDLLDNSPKRYDTVTLLPSLATLVLEGGPEGAEVAVDGDRIGRLPVDPHEICPGEHTIEATQRGRTIWSTTRTFAGSSESRMTVEARPNAVVFAEVWPPALRQLREDFNAELRTLPQGADPTTVRGWERLGLDADIDLAVAILPSDRLGAGDRWFVFSPILRAVDARGRLGDEFARPTWQTTTWGVKTADSAVGGDTLVVALVPGSSAASSGLQVGARIQSVSGRSVARSRVLQEILDDATSTGKTSLDVEWIDGSGETRSASLSATASPQLQGRSDSVSRDAARAAWAVIDALVSDEPAPLANLSLLFASYGHPESAAQTLGRVRWSSRSGIGDGTTQYYLGHALVAKGDEEAAVAAYRRAAASDATVFNDHGPKVGPAAQDCLADLGVSR